MGSSMHLRDTHQLDKTLREHYAADVERAQGIDDCIALGRRTSA